MISSLLHLVGLRPRVYYTLTNFRGGGGGGGAKAPLAPPLNTPMEFGKLSPSVISKLFNQYCCSFYGSPLWSISGAAIQALCVDWRKALRSMWRLNPRTHCDLITALSSQIPLIVSLNPIRSGGGGALKAPPLRFFALTHLILELYYCALVTFPKK